MYLLVCYCLFLVRQSGTANVYKLILFIYINTPTFINIKKILILCPISTSLVTLCIILYLSLGFYKCPSCIWRSGFWTWWHLFPDLGCITITYYQHGIINVAFTFTFSLLYFQSLMNWFRKSQNSIGVSIWILGYTYASWSGRLVRINFSMGFCLFWTFIISVIFYV